jgi:hypothetical protein
MNKKISYFLILITGILVTNMMTSSANAQTTPGISYPVVELGNCSDKAACKTYCDKSENVDACLSFAEKNNLMSKDEIKTAKNFKKTGMVGPGGCKGKDECKSYCGNPEHMDECITFAEKNGMMSGEKLDEAKKVKAAIAKGIKPPACGGKEACDAYCSSAEHMDECVRFGEEAGVISKEDAEKIRKTGGKGQGKGQGGQQGPDGRGPKGGGDKVDQGKGGPGGGQGRGNGGKGQGRGQGQERDGQQGPDGRVPGEGGANK